ncbi:discoidin domain-containing protein [Streptomyces sp. NPDC051976]|uniref:discoidin domain-containing protein n=1 Tax=Streptomyces sp. NPDC051976 TaxID=3154947 RepID=UPI003429A670
MSGPTRRVLRRALRPSPTAVLAAACLLALGAAVPAHAATGQTVPGDLACSALTTATTSVNSTNAADTTDCDLSTSWQSNGTHTQELSVDLGVATPIGRVVISWGSGYGTSFRVRTSDNGTSWTTRSTVSAGTGGTQTVLLPSVVSARYVELYLLDYAGSSGYKVKELEVFGPTAYPPPAQPAWTGQFTGYGTTAWKAAWGMSDSSTWNLQNLKKITDSTAPGDGSALQVTYGAGSSSASCTNCPTQGGAQYYTDLSTMGMSALKQSRTLDLRYALKVPVGFDWGKAGKLPGLYGGTIGEESGGAHGNGWSTRYMWRGDTAPNEGEVYLYTPTSAGPTGYGVDLALGDWNWAADGAWHTVEQLVDRGTGDITVWLDGRQVTSLVGAATDIGSIPFSGVFFSTFYGGHDTSWGPAKTTHTFFADFSLSTSLQH